MVILLVHLRLQQTAEHNKILDLPQAERTRQVMEQHQVNMIDLTTQQNGSAQQINKGEQLCQMRQVII